MPCFAYPPPLRLAAHRARSAATNCWSARMLKSPTGERPRRTASAIAYAMSKTVSVVFCQLVRGH